MKKPTKKPKKPKKSTVKAVTFAVRTNWTCKEILSIVRSSVESDCAWYDWKLHRKVQVRDEGER